MHQEEVITSRAKIAMFSLLNSALIFTSFKEFIVTKDLSFKIIFLSNFIN